MDGLVENAIVARTFRSLCRGFGRSFRLPPKGTTQDDPFDRFVCEIIDETRGLRVFTGTPNVSPDVVVMLTRRDSVVLGGEVDATVHGAVGIEIKRVRREVREAPRLSTLDYNTTPPSPMMRVEVGDGTTRLVESCYLFALTDDRRRRSSVEGFVLSTGFLLDEDMDLYDDITMERSKRVGLGSFGDLIDRQRPFVVGPNPLGIEGFSNRMTLIHHVDNLHDEHRFLRHVGRVHRPGGEAFHCYRLDGRMKVGDVEMRAGESKATTSRRGRFRLPLRPR